MLSSVVLLNWWGKHVPVNEVATRCGTIGYELMCAIALRVPIVEDDE